MSSEPPPPSLCRAASMLTGALAVVLPPAPVHTSVNVDAVVSGPLASLPFVAFVPVHAPDAVQVVAFWLDHVRLVAAPDDTVVGVAVRLTTGSGGAVATASEYVPAF